MTPKVSGRGMKEKRWTRGEQYIHRTSHRGSKHPNKRRRGHKWRQSWHRQETRNTRTRGTGDTSGASLGVAQKLETPEHSPRRNGIDPIVLRRRGGPKTLRSHACDSLARRRGGPKTLRSHEFETLARRRGGPKTLRSHAFDISINAISVPHRESPGRRDKRTQEPQEDQKREPQGNPEETFQEPLYMGDGGCRMAKRIAEPGWRKAVADAATKM